MHYFRDRIASVMARIATIPVTLTLEQQSLFALGYYHQIATDRAKTKEASERKRQTEAPPTAAAPHA